MILNKKIASYSINFDSHSTREVSPTPFVVAATPEPKARPAFIYYTDFPRNASPTPVSTLVPTPTPGPVTVNPDDQRTERQPGAGKDQGRASYSRNKKQNAKLEETFHKPQDFLRNNGRPLRCDGRRKMLRNALKAQSQRRSNPFRE
jgi:hypothetical protein